MTRSGLVLLLMCSVTFIGCGGADTTTVHGKVTYQGKPVTRGVINFQAEGGQPYGGAIQPDGAYSFEAPPGEYQVRIDSPPEFATGREAELANTSKPISPRQVPERFAGYDASGLTASVSEDSDEPINFDLQ